MARLGDYIEQIRGVSYKPEDVCTAQDKDAVAILRANNIQDDGLNFDDLVYVKKSKVSAIQYIKAGDIVVCASSGSKNLVGKAAIATEDMDFSFGAFCKVVRPRKLLPSYVGHYFQSPKYRNKISELAGGANINNIRNEHIDELDIVVPNTDEQERISIELNKNCYLISLRKQQLSKLDELVKSRFIEMFGDPETNPRKWPISKLSEFCDLQNGYAFRSEDYLDNSTVLNCRMSNIRPDGGFDAEYHPKYLPETFWNKYKEYRLIDGDVIIAMTDMASDPKILGVPTIVRTNGYKFLLNQRVGKLSFYDNSQINNVYLMFVLSQKNIRQQLVKSAGGSTQINVGKPAILGVEFFVPTLDLQNQFAAFVEQTDKSKLAIQQSLEKLETLKKALMQKYFG